MLTEIKTSYYEPLYALTEAEKIIDLQKARERRKRKRERTYFVKQKLCGALMIGLGCMISVIDSTAGMASVICVAIGAGLIVTHQHIMMFRG